MRHSQFVLLKDRRFAPLFVTQFLGAFNDNLFKNALAVLLLYGVGMNAQADPKLLVTLAAGLFILPFVLFSGIGGQLADKYPKERVIRIVKLAELGIAAVASLALFTGSVVLCFTALFALGTQSAFFGPSKYSILPQHLARDELIGGNALLNTGTFLAILTGTIAGTALAALPGGKAVISLGLFLCAAVGYLASRLIPAAPPKDPGLTLNFNPLTETLDILRGAFGRDRAVVRAILGVGWFYFLGGVFMAQMPNYTREALGADQYVLALFLTVFSVGVAAGGLLNNRLLKGRVEALYVPLAALAITIFSIDLYAASGAFTGAAAGDPASPAAFFARPAAWRVVMDIAAIAAGGGLFVVPLNAIIQVRTPDHHRARVMAGSAIVNALFVVASSVISAVLIGAGWEIRDLFFAFALANAAVAVLICALLPDYLLKSAMQALFRLLYKVEVRGLENLEKAGPRAVIVGNHVSLLDPPILAAFLPGRPMFAVNSFVAQWWWVRPFLRLVDAFPLDPANPYSMKSLIRKVEENRHVVIFPEGRLTETGALMKIYDGPGMVADKAGATIVPVRLDGVQYTPFARLKGKVRLRRLPKITVTILEPRRLDIDPALRGRARRAAAGLHLYDVMEEMMFLTAHGNRTLFSALLDSRALAGSSAILAEDVERRPLSAANLVRASLVLGRALSAFTRDRENVGLMLPNSTGALAAFFALQAFGRVPAMLNFSAGAQAVLSACETAQVRTVLTSRRFVELARLTPMIDEIAKGARIVYLEDIKKDIGLRGFLYGLTAPCAAGTIHARKEVDPGDPAVILFTSGSEGSPKGVVLSHENLLANIAQLSARVDFNRRDIVFNCLPMFHSFGLTGGTLLPVLSGVKTFLYPSPLHYRIVPEMVYAANATIMFGTDTFLNGYARMADPYDFYRMRYIFAGAEKVRPETRRLYMDRFGVRILEGYGATETAPVIAVNAPMHNREGTVGRFLPGLTCRLEEVPGVEEGGRLYVRGPNVMLGYYTADAPGVLKPPAEGWHDTGDIVSVSPDGYVTIMGRAKRFAKIAGEMVSLAAVESMAASLWPDAPCAALAFPDPRKGEQIVLATTAPGADRAALSSYAAQNGVTALAVPATVLVLEKMPVLASGKTDYQTLKTLIGEKLQMAA